MPVKKEELVEILPLPDIRLRVVNIQCLQPLINSAGEIART
jgi:hypothetical protein